MTMQSGAGRQWYPERNIPSALCGTGGDTLARPKRSQAPYPKCGCSPRCRRPSKYLKREVLPADAHAFWVHQAPIDAKRTQVHYHPGDDPDVVGHYIASTPLYLRGLAGYHLDLLVVTRSPARPVDTLVVTHEGHDLVTWVLASFAWKTPDGPFAELVVGSELVETIRRDYNGRRKTAEHEAVLDFCVDILEHRAKRRGRPPTSPEVYFALVEQAKEARARFPDMPLDMIAREIGTTDKTLREARRVYDREHGGPREPSFTVLRRQRSRR